MSTGLLERIGNVYRDENTGPKEKLDILVNMFEAEGAKALKKIPSAIASGAIAGIAAVAWNEYQNKKRKEKEEMKNTMKERLNSGGIWPKIKGVE